MGTGRFYINLRKPPFKLPAPQQTLKELDPSKYDEMLQQSHLFKLMHAYRLADFGAQDPTSVCSQAAWRADVKVFA